MAQGALGSAVPPQTKTLPSGNRTALTLLRATPPGTFIGISQVGVSVERWIIWAVSLPGALVPPTTSTCAICGSHPPRRTDMPRTRSGNSATSAISVHAPVAGALYRRNALVLSGSPVPPGPGPAEPNPVRE